MLMLTSSSSDHAVKPCQRVCEQHCFTEITQVIFFSTLSHFFDMFFVAPTSTRSSHFVEIPLFFFFVLGVLWGVSDPWLVAQPTTATIAAPHVAAAVKPRVTSAAVSRSGSCMYVPGIVHIFLPVSANQGRNTGYAWETEVGDSPEGRQHPGVTQNGPTKNIKNTCRELHKPTAAPLDEKEKIVRALQNIDGDGSHPHHQQRPVLACCSCSIRALLQGGLIRFERHASPVIISAAVRQLPPTQDYHGRSSTRRGGVDTGTHPVGERTRVYHRSEKNKKKKGVTTSTKNVAHVSYVQNRPKTAQYDPTL